jgi:hypothetical protein
MYLWRNADSELSDACKRLRDALMSQRRKLSAYDVLTMVEMDSEYSHSFIAKTFHVTVRHVIRILEDPKHYLTENNLSNGVFQLSSAVLQVPIGMFRIVPA